MEYLRTKDCAGKVSAWADAERYAIIDQTTGKLEPFAGHHIGSLEDAFSCVEKLKGWEHRKIIVKLSCICAFAVEASDHS